MTAVERRIKQAMGADKLIVTVVPGGTRYEALRGKYKRPDGQLDWKHRLKWDLFDGWVNCVNIVSLGDGWLELANELTRHVLKPYCGAKYVIVSPGSERMANTLMKHAGYKPIGGGKYRWDLEEE